jgi:hypothetical protein
MEANQEDIGKRRRKSKRSKEKRKDRLLKFHQKLVQVSVLPPSRLMLEQTPQSNKNRAKLNRKKLNFDLTPGKQEPAQTQVKQPPAISPPGSDGAGTSSNINYYSMLCSTGIHATISWMSWSGIEPGFSWVWFWWGITSVA